MMFKKNKLVDIKVTPEVYQKIKVISAVENKDFSEVIEESLQGKQITL